MARPSVQALFRHVFGSVRRYLSGKPLNHRRRVGLRKIHPRGEGNRILSDVVSQMKPQLVSRLGTTENSLVQYFVEHQADGECVFPNHLKTAITELSGFFPAEDPLLSQFSRETIEHLKQVDVLGVRSEKREHAYWSFEEFFIKRFARSSTLIDLNALVPLGNPQSWTRKLKGRKVLVIHPFAHTVTQQFAKRHALFDIPDFLPDCDLDVLPAVQSVGDNSSQTGFATWFDALASMKREIARRDFDVALVGAGAYGLFLAAECKMQGKVVIHIGGATQLLFGIIGRRWTNPSNSDSDAVLPFINEHWTGPTKAEVPLGAAKVEGGCYWM